MDNPANSRALWVLDPNIVPIEGKDGETRLWHTRRNWEIPIGRRVADLIDLFAVPRTECGVIQALGRRLPNLDNAGAQAIVQELMRSSVLIQYEPDGGYTPAGRGGLFGAPVLPLAQILRGETADVVVLGAPYDLGVTHRPGARFAPNYLRRASGALFQYREGPQGPGGMWDPVRARWLLRGIRLADAGDLSATVFHRNGVVFDEIEGLVTKLSASGHLPVVLGGDHSISLPVVRGIATAKGTLGVLHIDAHADLGTLDPGDWREECHHGNFMSWVLSDPRVAVVIQIGIRQLSHDLPITSSKINVWPGVTAAHCPAGELLATIPNELSYHLTIDVDALDPTVLPSTGTPLPGGFFHRELAALLELLCEHRTIAGIDVTEMIPASTDVEGLIVCDLLLRAISAARTKAL